MQSESLDFPEPYKESGSTIGYWMIYVLVGGAVFFVVGMQPTACRGATRSTKLKWETQQEEMRQIIESEGRDHEAR